MCAICSVAVFKSKLIVFLEPKVNYFGAPKGVVIYFYILCAQENQLPYRCWVNYFFE